MPYFFDPKTTRSVAAHGDMTHPDEKCDDVHRGNG